MMGLMGKNKTRYKPKRNEILKKTDSVQLFGAIKGNQEMKKDAAISHENERLQ